MEKCLVITGIRGIPARHGGFETFAEHLSVYLCRKGWEVVVCCQTKGSGGIHQDEWRGVRRVNIPVNVEGPLGTVIFDLKSIVYAARVKGLVLTLGYNTAIFNGVLRVLGVHNIINMDGIEWKRGKWSWAERMWLRLNERIACAVGNHLIADHPEIKAHLLQHVDGAKISTIAYGANAVNSADCSVLKQFGVEPGQFALVIARAEPENSILEIVRAFASKPRSQKLIVLGRFDATNKYHQRVQMAANSNVLFPGPIYEQAIVESLRFFCRIYVHGHQVGGTNPSLVEALGAGSPVLAHDNVFNRWVAGEGAAYFTDEYSCARLFDELLSDDGRIFEMSVASRKRFDEEFRWEKVLDGYEELLQSRYS